MILYGSSGMGALEEVLLLKQLIEKERAKGTYFIYPQSPDAGVRALHSRFYLGSEHPSFKLSAEIITRDFGLSCVELGQVLAEHGFFDLRLANLIQEIPGNDYNVLNHLNFKKGVRKSALIRPDSYLTAILDRAIGDLHKSGFYLGGRLIYWSISRICAKEGWRFMAPFIRTDDVYSFFDEGLLTRIGSLHIRLTGAITPEEGWEPVPPTVWPPFDKCTQNELLTVAKWLIEQPNKKIDVLLEGDRKKVTAFYRGLPLNF